MKMANKIALAIAALTASKQSIASTFVAGLIGAGLASKMGFDPIPWIIGAGGGVIIRVKLPPKKSEGTSDLWVRFDSVANGLISVMLAGLVAPWLISLAEIQKLPIPNGTTSIYVLALILAVLWPWFVSLWPNLKKAISTKLEKWSEK